MRRDYFPQSCVCYSCHYSKHNKEILGRSAATLWSENATQLTGTEWRYVKVPQKEFETLQPDEFADVLVFAPVPLL
jgi:hypothetical protein